MKSAMLVLVCLALPAYGDTLPNTVNGVYGGPVNLDSTYPNEYSLRGWAVGSCKWAIGDGHGHLRGTCSYHGPNGEIGYANVVWTVNADNTTTAIEATRCHARDPNVPYEKLVKKELCFRLPK